MRTFEIEQKYRLKDPKKVRALLRKLGARKVAGGIEINEFFDRGKELSVKRFAMRLRQFAGKAVLTLKGARIKSRFTKRMEVETPVDYRLLKTILGLAGFKVVMCYKKNRELYKLGKAAVTVDFLKKFGWFLEIEGTSRSIGRAERQLGLLPEDREGHSYLHMLFNWKH